MPIMDGLRLTQTIRGSQRFRSVPVVLVTGQESETDRMRGLQAGADAYVLKSAFDQKALLDTIAEIL
jgi:two-component system chemotaxis sensor kinase CheA